MAKMEKLEVEALDELAGGKGLGTAIKGRWDRMSSGAKTALLSALGVTATVAVSGTVDQVKYGGAGRKWLGGKIAQGAGAVKTGVGKVAESVRDLFPYSHPNKGKKFDPAPEDLNAEPGSPANPLIVDDNNESNSQ